MVELKLQLQPGNSGVGYVYDLGSELCRLEWETGVVWELMKLY